MDLKTKRTICLMVGIISILTIVGTISYAYFTATANMVPVEATLTTGTARVRFADNDLGFNAELNFGESVTKKFTIENIGTVDANVKMYWLDLINTYLEGSLTYTLSYASDENGSYTEVVSKTNVPISKKEKTEVLANSLMIPVGETYYYNLEITLNYLDDVNQDADLNAVFNTSFRVNDINYIELSRTLMAVTSTYTGEIWGHKEDIKQIVFESSISPKSDAVYTYDLSDAQDGSVMSYLVPDSSDKSKYIAYIQADGKIKANPNSSSLFHNFTNMESIDNLALLDTSDVTDMSIMFHNCSSLTTLDLSNFDTRNVTDMGLMFQNCSSLTILDLSNFDTNNVTNMRYMFSYCNNLTTLDLSNFDTSNVTNMQSMFYICQNLITLDVTNFDTSNVTDMSYMFTNCDNLTTLDLSNFDTNNVTNMQAMFLNCYNLTTLDVSNLDTRNVTNMNNMFDGCKSLTTLDVSNFDTNNVTNMSYMFQNCSNLTTTITIRGTKCTTYTSMFNNAATVAGSKITVNYTSDASSLVTSMIATKSSNSNVVKGSVMS